MRLEHVNLTVADLDRSVDFYRSLLGFGVRWEGDIGGGRRGAHVGDDGQYLALFEAAEGTGPTRRPEEGYGRPGINHVGFVVDDLEAARRSLEQLGSRVHHEADYDPGRRIYALDPDGNEIELVTYDV